MNWKWGAFGVVLFTLGFAGGVGVSIIVGGNEGQLEAAGVLNALPGIVQAFQPYLSFGVVGLSAMYLLISGAVVAFTPKPKPVVQYFWTSVALVTLTAVILFLPIAFSRFDTDKDRACLRTIKSDWQTLMTDETALTRNWDQIRGSIYWATKGGTGGETPEREVQDAEGIFDGAYITDNKAVSGDSQVIASDLQRCVL